MQKTCRWVVFILNYHERKIYYNNSASNGKKNTEKNASLCKNKKKIHASLKTKLL